jgi:hypothetical protein
MLFPTTERVPHVQLVAGRPAVFARVPDDETPARFCARIVRRLQEAAVRVPLTARAVPFRGTSSLLRGAAHVVEARQLADALEACDVRIVLLIEAGLKSPADLFFHGSWSHLVRYLPLLHQISPHNIRRLISVDLGYMLRPPAEFYNENYIFLASYQARRGGRRVANPSLPVVHHVRAAHSCSSIPSHALCLA